MHVTRRLGGPILALTLLAAAGCGGGSDESGTPGVARSATHAWGDYHWARTSNPFTLYLGDNVSSAWDAYLGTASSDWSQSTVLDTVVVAGGTRPRPCKATTGRVEVCDASYGYNGWLGVASITYNTADHHIVSGTVKMNDSYFKTSTYNTSDWRQLVMCQEIGHTLGLDHQDTNFDNANLGTCMDYTSNPAGPPSNLHPNQHDYDELATIYQHLDTTTTVGQVVAAGLPGKSEDVPEAAEWGRLVRASADGRLAVYELDVGDGQSVLTFVIWALDR